MMETKNESNISMTSHPLSVARLGATTMLLYQIYHDAATWKAPPIRLFPSNSSILKNCIFPWTCFPLFDPAVLWFFPYNSYISPAAFLLISQCRLIWTYAMIKCRAVPWIPDDATSVRSGRTDKTRCHSWRHTNTGCRSCACYSTSSRSFPGCSLCPVNKRYYPWSIKGIFMDKTGRLWNARTLSDLPCQRITWWLETDRHCLMTFLKLTLQNEILIY